MAGYCTLVLYFHSPAARENTTAHSCNIQPYCPLTHQIIYIYIPWTQGRLCDFLLNWCIALPSSNGLYKFPVIARFSKSKL